MTKRMSYADAIQDALGQAMADDPRVIVMGEDSQSYRNRLFTRFGPKRVLSTPISESAFLGAAVTASMAGLRPVVDLTLIDFVGVAADALLNHAAKVEAFTGGRWNAPLVLWAAGGGGYGDGGQHQQSLWGWLAHIPGLVVLVPSNPADAGALMLAAIEHEGPVVFLEHKLLSDNWLDWMGGSTRESVNFDVPADGAEGPVPKRWLAAPIGNAKVRRGGDDLVMITLGVSLHRCLEAAETLSAEGVHVSVVDLRSVSPLDQAAIREAVRRTGRLLVVDEDYEGFGLSGEVAAVALEAGLTFRFGRVCTQGTIPYARHLEEQVLPNVSRIVNAARKLMEE